MERVSSSALSLSLLFRGARVIGIAPLSPSADARACKARCNLRMIRRCAQARIRVCCGDHINTSAASLNASVVYAISEVAVERAHKRVVVCYEATIFSFRNRPETSLEPGASGRTIGYARCGINHPTPPLLRESRRADLVRFSATLKLLRPVRINGAPLALWWRDASRDTTRRITTRTTGARSCPRVSPARRISNSAEMEKYYVEQAEIFETSCSAK